LGESSRLNTGDEESKATGKNDFAAITKEYQQLTHSVGSKPDLKSLPSEILALIFCNLNSIDAFCFGNTFKEASKELLRVYGKTRLWQHRLSPRYDRRIIWDYNGNKGMWMAKLNPIIMKNSTIKKRGTLSC